MKNYSQSDSTGMVTISMPIILKYHSFTVPDFLFFLSFHRKKCKILLRVQFHLSAFLIYAYKVQISL